MYLRVYLRVFLYRQKVVTAQKVVTGLEKSLRVWAGLGIDPANRKPAQGILDAQLHTSCGNSTHMALETPRIARVASAFKA